MTLNSAYDDPTVDAFERALGESGAVAAISVGSGTITDIVKLAYTTVLAATRERMIRSGLGDLLSKPVSNADWTISAELGLSEYSPQATVIIERGSESFLLSGFAMSVAGGSAPASGGEHLVSHYIAMTALADGIPHDFHGCQVGVGILAAAHFYEHLRGPGRLSAPSLAQGIIPWQEYTGVL